jgi:hypothetical protein
MLCSVCHERMQHASSCWLASSQSHSSGHSTSLLPAAAAPHVAWMEELAGRILQYRRQGSGSSRGSQGGHGTEGVPPQQLPAQLLPWQELAYALLELWIQVQGLHSQCMLAAAMATAEAGANTTGTGQASSSGSSSGSGGGGRGATGNPGRKKGGSSSSSSSSSKQTASGHQL